MLPVYTLQQSRGKLDILISPLTFCNRMHKLPIELIELSIDYLRDDTSSLRTCSLTCRDWRFRAQGYLLRSVRITPCSPDNARCFVAALRDCPHIKDLVVHLTLDKLRSILSLTALPTLPAVTSLSFTLISLDGDIDPPSFADAIHRLFPRAASLRLINCRFRNAHVCLAFLLGFSAVSHLHLNAIDCGGGNDAWNVYPWYLSLPRLNLHTISVANLGYQEDPILKCFAVRKYVDVRSLCRLECTDPCEWSDVLPIIQKCTSLCELSLHFTFDFNAGTSAPAPCTIVGTTHIYTRSEFVLEELDFSKHTSLLSVSMSLPTHYLLHNTLAFVRQLCLKLGRCPRPERIALTCRAGVVLVAEYIQGLRDLGWDDCVNSWRAAGIRPMKACSIVLPAVRDWDGEWPAAVTRANAGLQEWNTRIELVHA